MTGRAREWMLVGAVFAAVATGLHAAAAVDGNFWWSDAPRHALNGAFVKDLIQAWPVTDPVRWAVDYYLHFPSLTILFYPPLFYAVEALAYGVFGVSHVVAQGTVALFVFGLMMAAYGLARRFMDPVSASAAGLLVVGAPEVSFWARQVMLDVPAFAAVTGGGYFFVRYLGDPRPRDLYWAVVCVVAAAWIKQTAAFVLPVFAIALLLCEGLPVLRRRAAFVAAIGAMVGLVPLIWLTMRFGGANMESVAGRPTDLPRWSVEAWTFYARLIPQYVGWPALVAALAGIGAAIIGRRTRPERQLLTFLCTWFAIGYVFFSFIGVREARHGLMLVLPVAVLAIAACFWWLPLTAGRGLAAVLALGTFVSGLALRPSPTVNGYREVADFVAEHAPPGAVVLFHGVRDGNFSYNLRAGAARRDITVLRTDKLLLTVVAGERVRGVREAPLSRTDIAALVRDLGVDLLVVQPGFWADLEPMARFEALANSSDFSELARFEITGNAPRQDRAIEVRRPTYPVARSRRDVLIEMPMLRGAIVGQIGVP